MPLQYTTEVEQRVGVGGVFCDSSNQLSVTAFTYERDSQGMIRTKPLLRPCEVEITTQLAQVNRSMIDCLCSVDYGKAALLAKASENLFNRKANAQIVDVAKEDSIAIMVDKLLNEKFDHVRCRHVFSE